MQYIACHVFECVLECLPPTLANSLQRAQVWWHLPLLALGFGGLAVASRFAWLWIRSRRTKKMERILEKFYEVLWDSWINAGIWGRPPPLPKAMS